MMKNTFNDRVNCKACNNLIINTFNFCQHCGVENISSSSSLAPVARTCSSFNDLDFNIITVITQYFNSKFKPFDSNFPNSNKTKQYNAASEELHLLFSLNSHYRRYKAMNFYFILNRNHSLKYYNNDDNFCLKMNVADPLKQLRLILNFSGIRNVSLLGKTSDLDLSYNPQIKDVSALGDVNTLNLSGCKGITNVSALGNVNTLNLSKCMSTTKCP